LMVMVTASVSGRKVKAGDHYERRKRKQKTQRLIDCGLVLRSGEVRASGVVGA
jgi:hypothetical protein